RRVLTADADGVTGFAGNEIRVHNRIGAWNTFQMRQGVFDEASRRLALAQGLGDDGQGSPTAADRLADAEQAFATAEVDHDKAKRKLEDLGNDASVLLQAHMRLGEHFPVPPGDVRPADSPADATALNDEQPPRHVGDSVPATAPRAF